MHKCSILGCGAKKSQNISLHNFPTNLNMRRRWINAIGSENISPRHRKNLFICSLHFEDDNINRTLGVIRLKDDAVPSLYSSSPTNTTARSVASQERIPRSALAELTDLTNQIIPQSSDQQEPKPNSSHVKAYQNEIKIAELEKICDSLIKQIKNLKLQVYRKNKEIAELKDIMEKLKAEKLITNEECNMLKEYAGPQDFLKRQVAKTKGEPLTRKYSEEIRKFALTLHFFSPKAYDYIRQEYNTCLPHTRTLAKWYQHVDAEPGFTNESFLALKRQVEQNSHSVICALIIDEMSIRKSLTWDPKSKKYYGRVDCGQNIDSDQVEEASQALVFLITSINGRWKLPIGYFLIKSLTGQQKGELINLALKMCEEVGVKVVSLTSDGPITNFAMFSHLGFDFFADKTVIEFNNTLLHAFIDPCHALKLIRNAFGELTIFYDHQDRIINFGYIEMLQELQENKGLHLATKLKKAHIFFYKQKMKVRLAAQIFSRSVADALEYCRDKLKYHNFRDCEGTVFFINLMNDVFDVLNSHSIYAPGWKKAVYPGNFGFVIALFQSAIDYIRLLKLPSGELIVNSRRKTGFIGLIIDMISTLSLYDYLIVKTDMLKYIPLYKINQDHLELFFSQVRARGGFNNNPNALQFRAAYKKLLIRAEIRDGGVGNCVPLEQISILTCGSHCPIDNLNAITTEESFLEIEEDQSDLYDEYLAYLTKDVDEYTESVLEYIAGFVIRKLISRLKCHKCSILLLGEENTNTLIYKKSRGGLLYASNGVLDVIKKTEKLLSSHLKSDKHRKPENYYLYIFKFMTEYYDTNKMFVISEDTEHNVQHRLMLIKTIIKTYLDLRYRYFGKLSSDRLSNRQHYNKLTLFRNE